MTQNRLTRLWAALVLILTIAVPVSAHQSRAAKFLTTYTITGDGATDIVAIAQAQLFRTGSSFGYTEEWCADFVSDCARLAGQSRSVPFHNNVYGLRDQILSAGGVITTQAPQPGDICFMDWESDGNWDHVEIVYMVSGGGIYTIGGNTGAGSSPETRRVSKHAPVNRNQIAMILRPRYGEQKQRETMVITEDRIYSGTDYEKSPVEMVYPESAVPERPAPMRKNILLIHTMFYTNF